VARYIHTFYDTNEDLYYPQNTEDLRKFYDYYMKGISNDWPFTPKVRLCILNPGGKDIINRPEREFPLSRQESRKIFLHSNGSMAYTPEPHEGKLQYEATTGHLSFTYKVTEPTELTGYFKLKLWVEAETSDMDIFTVMHKLDKDGTPLEPVNIDVGWMSDDPEREREKLLNIRRGTDPSTLNKPGEKALTGLGIFFGSGSTGRLRVSHRDLDTEKSTPHQPCYTHRSEERLSPGEIVQVEIEMWPHGMLWESGQQIRLDVSGHNLCAEGLPFISPPKTRNEGTHIIHVGGKYDSHILVPYIPKLNSK
jgi:predicted acyl esterase